MATRGAPLITARPCLSCESDGVNRVIYFPVRSARRRQQWQITDRGNDRQKIMYYLGSPMRDVRISLACNITQSQLDWFFLKSLAQRYCLSFAPSHLKFVQARTHTTVTSPRCYRLNEPKKESKSTTGPNSKCRKKKVVSSAQLSS